MSYWATPRPKYIADSVLDVEERAALAQCILPGTRVLNVGAGDPQRARDIWPNVEFTHVDLYPHFAGVERGDVRDLRYGDEVFDVVLCCRVLCNVPPSDRERAIDEMCRVLRPGGRLVVSDASELSHTLIQRYRSDRGWEPLPPSPSGSTPLGLSIEDWLEDHGESTLIAPDYVIWTRRDQEVLLPFGDPRALEFPAYGQDDRDLYGMYLMWEVTK